VLRTVALGGNIEHLSGLIRALEARGLDVRAAYAAGLDARPAIDRFFRKGDQPDVDLLVNATGFALVGGPAESRPGDARVALDQLDVGYLGLVPLAFQRVDDWSRDSGGLAPLQTAISVAVPELEGAADPLIYGGMGPAGERFAALPGEIEQAAGRIAARITLRRTPNAEKRVAAVIFNFPPNLGNIGSAAYLDVFASLHKMMQALAADGYDVEVPADADTLRRLITEGNQAIHGTDANVAARLSVEDYRRHFPHYVDIEPFWGPAPGDMLTDGRGFHILGRQFGKLFVGVQPSFGYERDPMRLLMAKDAAPNHAFAAFYAWLNRVFQAHAVVHVGTHGALEFMPGKQVGLGAGCWPTRLISDLPNFYLYSVNNPSEAAIAKRRGMATLVSYLVPPLQQAGLYKGLRQLKDAIEAYRRRPDPAMLEDMSEQALKLGLEFVVAPEADSAAIDTALAGLNHQLLQVEQRMIPAGLHVIGQPPEAEQLVDFLALAASFHPIDLHGRSRTLPDVVAQGLGYEAVLLRDRLAGDLQAQEQWREVDVICHEALRRLVSAPAGHAARAADAYLHEAANLKPGQLTRLWDFLSDLLARLRSDNEIGGLLRGLRGGFVPPSPSNDVVRDPSVVPTGRNVFSLDPARVPSVAAVERGETLATELLERLAESGEPPETLAVVLWGSDNLKSDCEGVAQVLALFGARPVADELGNISNVRLIPLAELGRPRIDVAVTVSGIFRDLLGNQMQLIDRAARMAAMADEPLDGNYVRKHALAQAEELGISLEDAAVRVFANAPGSYGANVNHLVESGGWDDDGQLGDAFLSRKSFTMSTGGEWRESRGLMERVLSTVDASFQNVDSFEVGISDIDNYYENLGGMSKTVEQLRGKRPSIMVADAVSQTGRLSTIEQMVRVETRAKLLNPKWYEAMLSHGYEGAREIEARLNNTYGWSATASAVEGWVYQGVAETFMLDDEMRERLTKLNPSAAAGVVRRLLEADGRGFWKADEETLKSLREIYFDLEDRLEGITDDAPAVR
jgi:magnesium chelatase subunit H